MACNRMTMGLIAVLTCLLATIIPALANNLVVTNTTLLSPAAGKVAALFDLSWDNSWRNDANYDACWVFVKYSIDGGSNWSHATLSEIGTNPPSFTNGVGTNLDIVVPADKTGAFIQRSVEGTGTVHNTGIKLWWDFATNGVSRSRQARIKVFAIEMVYIPEGVFWAGSGGSEKGRFIEGYGGGASNNSPFHVETEGQISVSNQPGCLWGVNYAIGLAGVLSNAYPKGYAAFYLMKTEASQRQYCDFLNTLTADQQIQRHDPGLYFNKSRNFIKKTSATPAFFGCDANKNAGPDTAVTNVSKLNESADGEWTVCNYISWPDAAAYADWAALRPFTELEFEKACRGPLAAVPNEYAWGGVTPEPSMTSLINEYTDSETPNQGNFSSYNAAANVYRCGSFARADSSREHSGAGYYGALDLSGSVAELTVTVGDATGRLFTGLHGDGVLSHDGAANVDNWPLSGSSGVGERGANWYGDRGEPIVSYRGGTPHTEVSRSVYGGLRCVRTAP